MGFVFLPAFGWIETRSKPRKAKVSVSRPGFAKTIGFCGLKHFLITSSSTVGPDNLGGGVERMMPPVWSTTAHR